MKRLTESALIEWINNSSRKPLILRGARQVGKTTMVRKLKVRFKSYVELNFEKNLSLHDTFSSDLDTKKIITEIQLLSRQKIIPGETLLFLDEIQAYPRALLALRYFYEEMPELHVIAAGSLLDFAIDDVGIPVGRVSFLHVQPLSFIEFLWALGETPLADAIITQKANTPFSNAIHEKSLRLLGEYIAIGGMPEAVTCWRDKNDYQACLQVHHDLIGTYQQDFHKYARSAQIKYVEHLFQQLPHQLSKPFRYAKVLGNYRKRELAPALELLKKAKVINYITNSPGFGLPLGAEAKLDDIKVLMLDVALTQALLGMTAEDWILHPREAFINRGEIAEAFVGQELLAYADARQDKPLYYWRRDKRSSQAEVDYLINYNSQITPLEVKSGKGNSLKSLKIFLKEHPESTTGIRCSTHNYSIFENLHSYPLYAVAAIVRNQKATLPLQGETTN